MREKLLDLMKNEGLKPSQLAELLEINPAGVSHILAGRNKPGFDLLQKILRRFPRINPDWLLLDSAQMYRTDAEARLTAAGNYGGAATASAVRPTAPADGLFGQDPAIGSALADSTAHYTAAKKSEGTLSAGSASALAGSTAVAVAAHNPKTGVAVRRVVICYEDDTFESYTPAQRS